jgi:hypothetical protein
MYVSLGAEYRLLVSGETSQITVGATSSQECMVSNDADTPSVFVEKNCIYPSLDSGVDNRFGILLDIRQISEGERYGIIAFEDIDKGLAVTEIDLYDFYWEFLLQSEKYAWHESVVTSSILCVESRRVASYHRRSSQTFPRQPTLQGATTSFHA